jgi:hypothetical protein
MKKLTPLLFALGLACTALVSVPVPSHAAQHACTLLCIQGDHCCVRGDTQECIPNSQPCP